MIFTALFIWKAVIFLAFVNDAQLDLGPGELLKSRTAVEPWEERWDTTKRKGRPPRNNATATLVQFYSQRQSAIFGPVSGSQRDV